MATRILGPTGSRRRRRFLFIPILSVVLVALLLAAGAQAVHDEGVFQLDGNASTASPSTPPALEDWDLICKASRVTVGTLAVATTASATSLSVTETTAPRIIPFLIQIDDEQMRVTNRTGTSNPRTYTVVRGVNGTTAAAHLIDAPILSGCLFNPGYGVPSGTTKASPFTFVVDPSETATDDTLKGGTKDDNDITSWKWASEKPSPAKNDLTDGYAAEYTCGGSEPNSISTCTGEVGDKLLYFGADRLSINGSANVAFWFLHKDTRQFTTAANGQCLVSQGCSFGDEDGNPTPHTVGNVSLGGSEGLGCSPNPDPENNICTPGDILVISAFGAHALINVYEWVGPGKATKDYLGSNSCFTAACSLQPLAVGGQECGNGPGQSGPNDNACAITNATQLASPWPIPQKEAPNNTFGADAGKGTAAFFEGGLNLTELGLADSCFSSFLINSRASASGDAELHDKLMGQFARCVPELTTQVQKGGEDFNGEVVPGQPVNDTATVEVTGATNPDDATGTVDFFLCSDTVAPFVAPDCSDGGVSAGADKPLVDISDPADPSDGLSGATSNDVNTTANPLAPGAYCFRAEADLTNYDDPDEFTNTTTECFTVAKLPTTTVTTPLSGSITLGSTITDTAVVTGSAAGGDPTGTVDFFVCGPFDSPALCDGTTNVGTAVTGNPVTCVPDGTTAPNDTTYTCSATSGSFQPSTVGRYCFRAVYSGNSVYNGSSDSRANECFNVTNSSSGATLQNWLPNDRVTVSTPSGTVPGTLSIRLFKDSCDPATGTLVYTEPVPNSGAFTATVAGAVYNTTNGSDPQTAFRVTDANEGTYFWRIVFTPTSSFATGFTKCETSTLTINDNPS